MNSGYQENAMTSEEREEYRALQARLKGLNDKILQAEHLRANAEYESNRYHREAFGVFTDGHSREARQSKSGREALKGGR